MIRAVAAAVARSFSAGASSGRVVLVQQLLTHRLGGFASTAAPSARQLRSCTRAASSSTTAADVAAATSSSPPPPPTPSFRAAIDFRALKASLPAAVANVEARRAVGADPELVARLYDEWRALQDSLEKVRAERNDNAAAMKKQKGLDAQARAALVDAGRALKDALADLEARAAAAENLLQVEAQKLPNVSHPAVPVGGEEDSTELRVVGERPAFASFEPKDHLELSALLGNLVDFDAGAAAAGAKFVYLRGAAARLELALCTWALNEACAAGFEPMTTPDLVRSSVLERCGFQPRADNTQVYSVADSPLCLTGTAEVPLAAVHAGQVVDEAALPIRMAAFGHCFRTEAGAAGQASRGLYRVHQFSKVELFVLSTPEQSEAILDELLAFEERLFGALGLQYRVLDIATGDLGAPAARKFDVEAWMPGMGRFGEVSSASNCTDYQARRLGIRYRPSSAVGGGEEGKKAGKEKAAATEFVHTLNATAAAVPRLVVAIIENFQDERGWVTVPEVLRPYMGGMAVIKPPGE